MLRLPVADGIIGVVIVIAGGVVGFRPAVEQIIDGVILRDQFDVYEKNSITSLICGFLVLIQASLGFMEQSRAKGEFHNFAGREH